MEGKSFSDDMYRTWERPRSVTAAATRNWKSSSTHKYKTNGTQFKILTVVVRTGHHGVRETGQKTPLRRGESSREPDGRTHVDGRTRRTGDIQGVTWTRRTIAAALCLSCVNTGELYLVKNGHKWRWTIKNKLFMTQRIRVVHDGKSMAASWQ